MEIPLQAVGYEESRIVSQVKRADGSVQELAVGMMTSHLIIRTPSGKAWVVVVPPDMITDVFGEERELGAIEDADLPPA